MTDEEKETTLLGVLGRLAARALPGILQRVREADFRRNVPAEAKRLDPPLPVTAHRNDGTGAPDFCIYTVAAYTPELLFVYCDPDDPPLRFLRRTGECFDLPLHLVQDGKLDDLREIIAMKGQP